MAIQPIDLSTVYSQMDNVAKFSASQNQLAQSVSQAGADRHAQDVTEKAKAVQEVAKQDAEAATVSRDARNSSSDGQESAPQKRKGEEPEEDKPAPYEFTDPRLGRHIDITG